MDIALYISDLLQKYDRISVSGLGTFYKKRVAGCYNDRQDSFIPPTQQIEYSSEYFPDARLAEYISEQKHISLGSSEHFIGKFTENIQNQLNTEQTADIHPLGVFHKTNNEYSFIASENILTDTAFYGLKPVKEVRRINTSVPAAEPVTFNELPAANESEPEIEQEQEQVVENKKSFPILMPIIVALLSGVIALYFFSPDTFRSLIERPQKQQNNKTVIPVIKPKTVTDSVAMADSIIESLGEQGFEVEQPRDTLKASIQAAPADKPTLTYEVIGASLNSQRDAERLVRNFKSKGIDAKIIFAKEKKRNNILISLGSFNTRSSADAELIRIRKDIEPGAYTYTYNKK